MSSFVTRVEREKEEPFTVIFTTDEHSKYIHIENECRKMIGHAKQATNSDRIRAMTDDELAEWIIKHDCYKNLYGYDPKDAVLDWLKQEVDDDTD